MVVSNTGFPFGILSHSLVENLLFQPLWDFVAQHNQEWREHIASSLSLPATTVGCTLANSYTLNELDATSMHGLLWDGEV